MLDEKTRMAVALKRFSVISPILNGQIKSITAYCVSVSAQPIELPHYGPRQYAPKTVERWYSMYSKGGIDALKPQPRSDRGNPRVITGDMAHAIIEKRKEYPKAPATVVYDMLVEDGAFMKKDVSLPTLRRFLRATGNMAFIEETPKEMLRFAMGCANDLWQTDLMYGPYVAVDGAGKRITYLLAYIDDATRLIAHAGFYLSQDIASLRDSFKDAVLRRGIPKILYSDNGQIYRSQSFEYLCAGIGVVLLHHGVREAHSKGKIERFFRTVRLRFISRLKKEDIASLGALNAKFAKWLDEDYQRKPHEGLSGGTPLDAFLAQTGRITLVTDLAAFNEKFLLSARRTVKKDATISLKGSLYETDMALCGMKVEVRYDPDGADGIRELLVFVDGKPMGTAKLVLFQDNAHRKRKGAPERKRTDRNGVAETKAAVAVKEHTISYSEMEERK
jgi:transposase InsO family protein